MGVVSSKGFGQSRSHFESRTHFFFLIYTFISSLRTNGFLETAINHTHLRASNSFNWKKKPSVRTYSRSTYLFRY